MSVALLVVDPDLSFATMVKEVLQEAGKFTVTLATTGPEALRACESERFDIALLESALRGMAVLDLIHALRSRNPELALMVIPPTGADDLPDARALDIQGWLPKPFFIPDLEGLIELALQQRVGGVVPEGRSPAQRVAARPPAGEPVPGREPPAPPLWLQDVNKAARHLTALTLEAGADASMLTRGSEMFAYAGQLPRDEADELARIVAESWDRDGGDAQSALVRFVQLSDGADYLLYATQAAVDLVLSMVFSGATSLGRIRRQARRVAAALLTEPENGPESGVADAAAGSTAARTGPAERAQPASRSERLQPEVGPKSAAEVEQAAAASMVDTSYDEPQASGAALAGLLGQTGGAAGVEAPESAATSAAPGAQSGLPATVSEQGLLADRHFEPLHLQGAFRTSHGLYRLSYAFAWIPKFPQIQLSDVVSERLASWIRQLVVAHDWRLEALEIEPRHVQAVVGCAPSVPPAQVVRTLMRETARRILDDFPQLAEMHAAGSFWAPGYYLVASEELLSPEQIDLYITYQRHEQGLEP